MGIKITAVHHKLKLDSLNLAYDYPLFNNIIYS